MSAAGRLARLRDSFSTICENGYHRPPAVSKFCDSIKKAPALLPGPGLRIDFGRRAS